MIGIAPYSGQPDAWLGFHPDGRNIAQRGEGDSTSIQVIPVDVVTAETGARRWVQILRAEKGGALTLLVDPDGRIGLSRVERPVTRDQNAWAAAWPKLRLDTLGRISWELTRGFAAPEDMTPSDTAFREAKAEGGVVSGAIVEFGFLGWSNDNTSSSPHQTTDMWAMVNPAWLADPTPDPNEGIIGSVQWFTLEELDELRRSGDLFCNYTLGAIALWMIMQGFRAPVSS